MAADGPYQATGFCQKLLEILNIVDDKDQLPFPVTWDAAHALNLGVVDIKDSKTESGNHFKRFIKRCNVFNNILSNGKGFAFLQLVDASARRPVMPHSDSQVSLTSNGCRSRRVILHFGKHLNFYIHKEKKKKSSSI